MNPLVPIALVVGFLGSGKTTFLQRLTRQYSRRRLAYLVNEFSSVDVDTSRLEVVNGTVVAIPGGSIFCRCLTTQFVAELRNLSSGSNSIVQSLDGVVIEASGVADPRVMESMLHECRLDEGFRLASVVTLVDPGSFGKLRHTLPNIVAQIEAADLVILNKTDAYDETCLAETEVEICRLNPRAQVSRASYARQAEPFELFPANLSVRGLRGDYATCRDPHYASFEVSPPGKTDLRRLEQGVLRCGEAVFRMKGVLKGTGGKVVQVDYSPSGFSAVPETGQGADASLGLVILALGDRADEVERFLVEPLRRGEWAIGTDLGG